MFATHTTRLYSIAIMRNLGLYSDTNGGPLPRLTAALAAISQYICLSHYGNDINFDAMPLHHLVNVSSTALSAPAWLAFASIHYCVGSPLERRWIFRSIITNNLDFTLRWYFPCYCEQVVYRGLNWPMPDAVLQCACCLPVWPDVITLPPQSTSTPYK